MKNRIRHFRQKKGLTQTELADLAGTTAATISRLETSDMTLSTDWLRRFADIFHVQVADLIDEPSAHAASLIGTVQADGLLAPPARGGPQTMSFGLPGDDPIAVEMAANLGAYRAGDVLICDRRTSEPFDDLFGQDCLVSIKGTAKLGRVFGDEAGGLCFVSANPGGELQREVTIDWIARVTLLVRGL